jgi:hypothetical protein
VRWIVRYKHAKHTRIHNARWSEMCVAAARAEVGSLPHVLCRNHWHCDTGHGRAIPHTESAKTCVHVAARWEVGRPSKELSPPQTRVPKRKTNRNPARPWTLACSAPTPQTTVPESGAGGGWNVGPEPESTDIRCSKTSRSTANIDSSDLRSQCGGLSGLHCVPTA